MQKWVADLPDYVPESAARLLQALLDKTIVEGLNFVKRNQKYQKVSLGTGDWDVIWDRELGCHLRGIREARTVR